MFDFNATPASEVKLIAIIAEAERIPESHWRLHTQLVLKCPCRRKPHLRACGAHCPVLEHHGHNGEHCQTAISNFGIQAPLSLFWIFNGWSIRNSKRPPLVRVEARGDVCEAEDESRRKLARWIFWTLVHCKELHGKAEENDLLPSNGRNLSNCGETMRNV